MAPHVDTQCAGFQEAIKILSRPWSALILGLLQGGPLRFSELESRGHGVGAKMLSARLKELEVQGLIVRRVEPGPPVKVDYALTERGVAFEKVATAIQQWGSDLLAPRECAKEPRGEREPAREARGSKEKPAAKGRSAPREKGR